METCLIFAYLERTNLSCAINPDNLIIRSNLSTSSAGDRISLENSLIFVKNSTYAGKYQCINSKHGRRCFLGKHFLCAVFTLFHSRGHDGSFQGPGGLTYNSESGVKRLRTAGQVLQTVMAETMQVMMTMMVMVMVMVMMTMMMMVMVMMMVDDWGESTLLGFDNSNNSRGSVSDSKISQIRSRLFHGNLFREIREILLAFSSRKTGKIEQIYSLNF